MNNKITVSVSRLFINLSDFMTTDFFVYSFSKDSSGRFVNKSLLMFHQRTLFINFNLKTLSNKSTDI